jgi:TRAP transporter TAXI family solute receptor
MMNTFFRALAVGLSTVVVAQAAVAADQLLIGSTSTSSSHYSYFVAVNQIINNSVPGVKSSVVETGATVDNLRRLARKQVDLGLVTTNVGYQAYKGIGSFEGKPVDTRLLWVYNVAPQNSVVRKDSGVNEFADLEGKQLNPGITGSATEKTTEAVLNTLGIKPDYVRGSTSDTVDAIKDNRIIGYVKSGVSDKQLDGSTLDIATFTPIRVLSLSDAQADTLREKMPDISVISVNPGLEGVSSFKTWAFGVAVHARPDLDEEIAYQIVKAIMENTKPQANAFSAIKDADLSKMTMDVGSVPLHAGAARYYREQGIQIPKVLQPVN